MVFACATLYGFGKTFFWPTTLGVVSEQCPKGGALTLNAIAGIGMLAVGILGGPVIGKMTEDSIKKHLLKKLLTLQHTNQFLTTVPIFLGDYTAVDAEKVGKLPEEQKAKVSESIQFWQAGFIGQCCNFPIIYVGLLCCPYSLL